MTHDPNADAMARLVTSELQSLWSRLLHVEVLDLDADFFKLGGDSMLAVRMLADVIAVYGEDIAIERFFVLPTITTLVELVGAAPNVPRR